uniref:Alpha 1,4-glycosyltransferase domain-containing protein n=1 Tax=Leptobrachium leishanense TaxID=445787 RepID=A0A8C5MD45_9ANUR
MCFDGAPSSSAGKRVGSSDKSTMLQYFKYLATFLLALSIWHLYTAINITKRKSLRTYLFDKNNPITFLTPDKVLRDGNGIIFLEITDRLDLPPLVLCSVESAARVYPDRPVAFFMQGLPDMETSDYQTQVKKKFPSLSYFQNVYLFPLRAYELFAQTPLLEWYTEVDLTKEKKKNFLAAESEKLCANSVFGLNQYHVLAWTCMEDFARNYNGGEWGYQGPSLFTHVMNDLCDEPQFNSTEDVTCGNIPYLNPQRFFPIPDIAWETYFEVFDILPTFNYSYSLHLWNFMNNEKKRSVDPGSNTLVDLTKEKYRIHVTADGCRLAFIWKYGGIYFDSDTISMRPIPHKNFLAAQSEIHCANGMFGLNQYHGFAWICMEDFVKNYDGNSWGHQGPQLFTRILKYLYGVPQFNSKEDITCGSIHYLHPRRFFPIPYMDWERYYEVVDILPTFNDSYSVHLWNFMSNTLVDRLFQQYCPTTHAFMLNNHLDHD